MSEFERNSNRRKNVEIGENAFYKCINLTKIVLNGNNVNKADSAFKDCNMIINIIVPNELVTYYRHNTCWSNYGVLINDIDKTYAYISPSNFNFGEQYYNEEKEKDFSNYSKTIKTKRLRTICFNNNIVLSATKDSSGIAYLEITFSHYVKELSFNISKFIKYYNLNSNDVCLLQYYEDNVWNNYFNLKEKINSNEDYYFYTKFDKKVTKIRIYLKLNNVVSDANFQVKIDGLSVSYYELFNEYVKYDKRYHKHYSIDGSYTLERHIITNTTGRIAFCSLCGQKLDLNTDGPFETTTLRLKDDEYA